MIAATVIGTAFGVEHLIKPDAKQDVETRVKNLELAVQELQTKVFNLSAVSAAKSSGEKKWYCEIQTYTKTFKAYGAGEIETRDNVKEACIKETSERQCSNVKCKLNN